MEQIVSLFYSTNSNDNNQTRRIRLYIVFPQKSIKTL